MLYLCFIAIRNLEAKSTANYREESYVILSPVSLKFRILLFSSSSITLTTVLSSVTGSKMGDKKQFLSFLSLMAYLARYTSIGNQY